MTPRLNRQGGDWQARLGLIVEMMRDMSRQTDPQEMVRSYAERVRVLLPSDGRLSLSRRGLTAPKYRITRSTAWKDDVNPWKEKDRLPLLEGGLLAGLIYGDQPHIIDGLDVPADDPPPSTSASLISSSASWAAGCSPSPRYNWRSRASLTAPSQASSTSVNTAIREGRSLRFSLADRTERVYPQPYPPWSRV